MRYASHLFRMLQLTGLVDSVFVAGRAVKRDSRLLDVDLPALRARVRGNVPLRLSCHIGSMAGLMGVCGGRTR